MMYTENSSINLQASTSVPLLFSSKYGRVSQSNSQSNNYSYLPAQQNVQGVNFNKFNHFKVQNQKEKKDVFDLSSSLNLNQTKKLTFTHNPVDDKSFRFQFKRNSAANQRISNKLDQSKEESKKSIQIYPNYAMPTQNYSNSQMMISDSINNGKLNEMQEKLKDLQNRLKFQEKYANDLYINSEEVKKQCSKVKDDNRNLQEMINNLNNQNDSLTKQLSLVNSMYKSQIDQNSRLADELKQKQQIIVSLQKLKENHMQQITNLKDTIQNFSMHYKNQLYQERIKQLNEEIYKTRTELTQVVIEKNRLLEELKSKNDKLICMKLDSPTKNKQAISKAFNASQKTNQAINMAFEQSIKSYKRQIEQLKEIIQKQQEQHSHLREQINDLRRQIEGLRQDQKINNLKYAAQKRNILSQNDRKITDKNNQINSLSNKLMMLQQKCAKASKQIDDKDQFLKNHLVGRAKDLQQKEYIQQVLQSYQQTFESRFILQQRLKSIQNGEM